MKILRHLAVRARPLTTLFNDNFMKNLNVIRMGQSKRNMMGETYEGTGKTTGYILNKKGIDVLCIDFITVHGFKLTNGWTVVGPTIFFPHTMISWRIKDLQDINEESLALFALLRPKLDCLFIGYGVRGDMTYTKLTELIHLCKRMDLKYEFLPTEDAAATFNFCSLDRRFIAAALIPPKKIIHTHDMIYISGEEQIV